MTGIQCVRLTYDIGQQQIPPGDKRQQLSNSHIAVQVRGAGLRNPGPELCVAQSGEYGRHGCNEEGDDDAGSCIVSGHLSGQHIHPCPQGAAHAKGHQVESGQASVKGGLLPLGIQRLPPREAPQKGLQVMARHASGGCEKVGQTGVWFDVNEKEGVSEAVRRKQGGCETVNYCQIRSTSQVF